MWANFETGAQAIPGLADRTRLEVTSIYEGSINALVRIHPPGVDATVYAESPDSPRQFTAAEVLLALQEQLAEPLSPLRTGPFGEYAAFATIGELSDFCPLREVFSIAKGKPPEGNL